MPYSAIAVANELVRARRSGEWVDPLKLQKLLYFANGWWLAFHGEPLSVERPEVWRYGPVFPSVYRAFGRYGSQNIGAPVPRTPFSGADDVALFPENDGDTPEARQLVRWIWDEYGHRTGGDLSDETHRTGTPWRKIAEANQYSVPMSTVIPVRDDYDYFSGLARQRGATPVPLKA